MSLWPGYCGPAWSASPAGLENGDGTTATTATIPILHTDNPTVDKAFRIAIGDLPGNVVTYKAGLLEQPVPVIFAGLDYSAPWTRDASINAWNGASLIIADVCRNTLLACVVRADGQVRIGEKYGQYWDAVVWATGARNHYLPWLRLLR
jgi:hypothetical protein